MKKIIIIFGIIVLVLLDVLCVPIVRAEDKNPLGNTGNITVSVSVVARKPADTINDFDYSQINPHAVVLGTISTGLVKGASTQKDESKSKSFIDIFEKVKNFFLVILK